MIYIILCDSELEIVPEELLHYNAVVANAKKRNKKPNEILLDATLHHSAIRKLSSDNWRRGRPDIVHITLLVCLDSILNDLNMLRVIVHTRNNYVIKLNPKVRLPRNYMRFVALMEQLFKKKILPSPKNPLLQLEYKSLYELVNDLSLNHIIVFSPNYKKVNLCEYFKNFSLTSNIGCILGGFPYGDYISDINKISADVISIYEKSLSVWTVANEIIVNLGNKYGRST